MARAPIPVGRPPAIDIALLQASDIFEETLARVPERAWDNASPCAGWTVHDVVGHVIGTVTEASAVLRGEPFSRDPRSGEEP